jgi:Bacterial DNA polymerase III alpha NTPase domain
MKTDQYGQIIYNESDLVNMLMRNISISQLKGMLVEPSVNLEKASEYLEQVPLVVEYAFTDMTMAEFDEMKQNSWHMPEEYQQLDIAEYILSLCDSDAKLQRCGEELLLFQERNLFDLLRYLKYLVDTMRSHNMIWGVGRGSSVASYVLYLLGVHRIDSMFYDLKPTEFLR